ncbi:restriction endonuclease [Pseudodesulfovibrio sp. F-1]|uniref:Restriction endonuclease n=1 Tax=Pseudodesulfovibrio alkaliphilus TaxID=2661613 RepID=A0A7K1KKC9_9BACT|nr:type I restriction endonuclease [Pseudodesulfovibrio alkaliphilus]MUM76515.1 restriction endonuclease [Pseudodesulfovibrio alkaliphilus]
MDFAERLHSLAARIQEHSHMLSNEEMTKNALVLPFLQTLGYDPFNPQEIFPEYTADIGVKKGEKVDFAVMRDGKPIMLIECKSSKLDLRKINPTQLLRYYQVTPSARIGVLTNGIQYQFFTDLDRANIMDDKPYMVLDFNSPEESLVQELKKLTKTQFDIEKTVSAASELKYTRAIRRLFSEEMQAPSDEFVRLFACKVYSGKLMPAVRQKFTELVKKAISIYINEVINDRLKSAMITESDEDIDDIQDVEVQEEGSGIITTEDEIEAFYIVKSILREVVSPERVAMRDTKSYCGVLLDDNNRKPLCRFHFNRSQYYLGIVVNAEKAMERVPIAELDDIYAYSDRLKATPLFYE